MKSRVLNISIGSSIFILLIISVLAVIRPAYERLNLFLSREEFKYAVLFKEKTGLRFSYKSLSPAIFSFVNIRGIEVYDDSTGEKIVEIKRAVLSYKFSEFFKQNPVFAVKKLTINGVTIEYDAAKNYESVKKIYDLIKSRKSSGTLEAETANLTDEEQTADSAIAVEATDEGSRLKIKELIENEKISLPFEVVLRNVVVHYGDKNNDIYASLNRLTFSNAEDDAGIIVKSSGTVKVLTEALKTGGRRALIANNFVISGFLVLPDIDGSSATVQLSGVTNAEYTISHIDSLLNYSDDKIQLRTMNVLFPLEAFAEYDLNVKKLNFSFSSKNLNPFKLVLVKNKNEFLQKIAGMTISGKAEGSVDSSDFSYNADLGVMFPNLLADSNLAMHGKFSGNKSFVKIRDLSVKHNLVDARYSGSFDFRRLQPNGNLALNYLCLKNGTIISSEFEIDPLSKGFFCFSPVLFMNDKEFNALQLTIQPEKDSVDFSVEFFDPSHFESDGRTGKLKLDGSYLFGGNNFLTAQLSLIDIFGDSALLSAAYVTNGSVSEKLRNLSGTFAPYLFTGEEIFFSTDFKKIFSFNVPLCFLTNKNKEQDILAFSADGSNQTMQVSQINLLYGNQIVNGDISLEFFDGFSEFNFSSNLAVNNVPYNFFGNYDSNWLSISGDYDFDAVVFFDDVIEGSLRFNNFPASIGKNIFSFSANATFDWSSESGIHVGVKNFEGWEPSGHIAFKPRFAISGEMNRYGFVFNRVSYSDEVSVLDASGKLMWNYQNGIFDSLHFDLTGKSPVSRESLEITADFTNPSGLPFSMQTLRDDFYFSAFANVKNFPVGRFLPSQFSDNILTADAVASGTLNNPLVSLSLHQLNAQFHGYPLLVSGSLVLDDNSISVSDLNASWSVAKISGFNAILDTKDFVGTADAIVDFDFSSYKTHIPLTMKIEGLPQEKRFSVPDYFSLQVSSSGLESDFLTMPTPFSLTATKVPGQFEVHSDYSGVFSALFSSDGTIAASVSKNQMLTFDVGGFLAGNAIEINVSNVHADLQKFSSNIVLPFFSFASGIVDGGFSIKGLTTDPEFFGKLDVSRIGLNIPILSKSVLKADSVAISAEQDSLVMPETVFTLGKGSVQLSSEIGFDRWAISSVILKVLSLDKKKVPYDMSFPFVHYKGNAQLDLTLALNLPDEFSVTGTIAGDNADVEIVSTALQDTLSLEKVLNAIPVIPGLSKANDDDDSGNMNFIVDLNLIVGQRVQILFNPFMKGLVVPDTPLYMYLDSSTGDFTFKGDVTLKGGDISYLSRSFYLKEGRIIFNETQNNIDPRITVRAETRERDDKGNQVSIILSARNQRLSEFNPVFSASPAKSEREIMELLGQIVSADSDSASALGGSSGDYVVQSLFVRRIEDALREVCNFDIFSIRTNVIQNAVKLNQNSDNEKISFSNFFDNSTVYIGKYFGSVIYTDAMLHWTYDETKNDNGVVTKGLVFQPEFGFELNSPYVNMRLGVAPNLESIKQNLWMPATSITLSWKHSF